MGSNEGLGQKPSDFRCVPLTAMEHRKLHNQGEKSFWLSTGIDPYEVMTWLLYGWLIKRGYKDLEVPREGAGQFSYERIVAVAEAEHRSMV